MVTRPIPLFLAAMFTVVLSASAGEAAESDELGLLPRRTVVVTRIASVERLQKNLVQAGKALLREAAGQLPEESADDVAGQSGELDETVKRSLASFGIHKLGESQHPQYAGLVLLPDTTETAQFGMVRAADRATLKTRLEELDRQRYDRETKTLEPAAPSAIAPWEVPEEPKTWHVVQHGPWLLYTDDERCVPLLRRVGDDRDGSMAAALDPPARKTLLVGDISGAVNLGLILRQPDAKTALSQARDGAVQSLDLLDSAEIPWEQWNTTAKQVKAYLKGAIDVALEISAEPRWAAGYLEFTAEAVSGAGLVTVRPEGHLDKFATARPPLALGLMGELPAGKPAYVAYRCDQTFQRHLLKLHELFAATVKEKLTVKALRRLLEAKPVQTAVAIDRPLRAAWGLRALSLTSAEDPQAFLDYERASSSQSHSGKNVSYAEGYTTFAGRPVDVKIEEAKEMGDADETEEDDFFDNLSKSIEGTYRETWMLASGKRFISAAGYAWEDAEAELAGLRKENSLTTRSEAFRAARRELDGEANVIVLVNLPDVVKGAMSVVASQFPAEVGEALAEPIGRLAESGDSGPASYSGLCITLLPEQVRGRFHVPVKQLASLVVLNELSSGGWSPVPIDATAP
jgi:hypothetical protein